MNDGTVYGTGIDPASIDGLALLPANQPMRVSGLVAANGDILATRIDLDTGAELEVTGVVTGLDDIAKTFRIGGLVIDYGSASIEGFPSGLPADDDRVEAEGTQFGSAGELIATRVKLKELGSEFEEDDRTRSRGIDNSVFICGFV